MVGGSGMWECSFGFFCNFFPFFFSSSGMHTEKFSRGGGGKLGPHKRMTLAIMIIAYIYTSICLLRFALFA